MSSRAVRGVALERNAQGNQRRTAQYYELLSIAVSDRHGEETSMPSRIEDYAIIGDLQTAALVGADGSVDWLCFPRFDSPACFTALLGEEANGRWRIAPTSGGRCTRRRYVENTLVLETEWEIPDGGAVRVVDCMPPRGMAPDLVRVVEGVRGKVALTSE